MGQPQTFALALPSGGRLEGLVDLPGEAASPPAAVRARRWPAVVVCHGFKGFMEWGFFPALASLLAERGFVVVRFNLSGAGMRPGDERVTDEKAFRENTHSRELEELLAVLAAVGREIAPGLVEPARLGLFGHSRGGGNAILAAAHPLWRERVRAVVTWAAIAGVDRFSPEQKEAWRRDGELPVVNARTGQRLALGRALLDDVESQRERLDILAAAARLTAPWLIVHGEDDESVPAADARRLDEQAASLHELLLIPGANHTFGSRHPFTGPTSHLIAALNATQTWFRRHL
jgi:dienelactone hydrolase